MFTYSNEKKNFYKFWWDEEMNLLKDESVECNKLWKAAGKPRHGKMISMTVCREKMALSFGIVGNLNLNLERTVFKLMVVLTTGKLLINSLTISAKHTHATMPAVLQTCTQSICALVEHKARPTGCKKNYAL